jgi:dipeptidyl aminopeptidase/acylaminoacyl peptidase
MPLTSGCSNALPDTSIVTPAVPPPSNPSSLDAAVSTTVLPTLAPGVNGAIESMVLITRTVNSEYYELTYWSDGYRVTGFLGRPRDDGLYPAIVYNRGGDHDYGALQGWEVALFVEAGYVAVASQYRGNAGSEGQERFASTEVNDVLNLMTLLKRLPYVDINRIGMMGHSRGGMVTYLALKQDTLAGTHDIKVAATVGGVSDLFMLYEEYTSYTLSALEVTPEDDPALYEALSATHWPDLINAPLLLQHGEADVAVPTEHSLELARVLEEAGKTVDLITYPGDDHDLTGHYWGLPAAFAWFQRYLANPGEDLSFGSHSVAMRAMMTWFQTSYQRP